MAVPTFDEWLADFFSEPANRQTIRRVFLYALRDANKFCYIARDGIKKIRCNGHEITTEAGCFVDLSPVCSFEPSGSESPTIDDFKNYFSSLIAWEEHLSEQVLRNHLLFDLMKEILNNQVTSNSISFAIHDGIVHLPLVLQRCGHDMPNGPVLTNLAKQHSILYCPKCKAYYYFSNSNISRCYVIKNTPVAQIIYRLVELYASNVLKKLEDQRVGELARELENFTGEIQGGILKTHFVGRQQEILEEYSLENLAEIFPYLLGDVRKRILEKYSPKKLAEILQNLTVSDQRKILPECPAVKQQEILEKYSPEKLAAIFPDLLGDVQQKIMTDYSSENLAKILQNLTVSYQRAILPQCLAVKQQEILQNLTVSDQRKILPECAAHHQVNQEILRPAFRESTFPEFPAA